jgi:hypothetical protein
MKKKNITSVQPGEADEVIPQQVEYLTPASACARSADQGWAGLLTGLLRIPSVTF